MSVKKPFVRNPYNYDRRQASHDSALFCKDKSLARQEFVEESDINFIADKFGLTGELPQIEGFKWGGHFEGIFDFQSAQNAVRHALEEFAQLPADLRARFDNDAGKLIAFLDNPKNRKEAEFLGLLKRPDAVPELPQGAPAQGKGGDPLSPPAPKAPGAPATPPTKDT